MPYTAEISRRNPTCFVFLIDQSKSMSGSFGGSVDRTKAQGVADALNSLLRNLVIKATSDTVLANRFFISVIGYGESVGPALGGKLRDRLLVPIQDIGDNPLRVDKVREQVLAPSGTMVDTFVRRTIWVEPIADGKTPMCEALEKAAATVTEFLTQNPECFPPTVVNITDGHASDGDPTGPARALRGLNSTDGNVLLFNIHLSNRPGTPLAYPASLPGDTDPYTRMLFGLSSPLPPVMLENARHELPLEEGARGFAYNADLSAFVKFLNTVTQTQVGKRARP